MEFGVIQIVGGILMIIASILIVILTTMQSQKDQGMTSAISGSSNDSFFKKNSGNTKERAIEQLTKVVATVFFILVLAVNVMSALS